MTTEEFLKRAKELRADADAARHLYLQFLVEHEEERGIWEGSGLAYPTFLERNDLTKASVYVQFKMTYQTLGSTEVESVGVNAVVAAGRFKQPEQQREVLDEARKFEEVNGTTISEQSAQKIANDVRQREAAQRGRHRNYASLVDENERLRFAVKRLKDKVAALEAELKAARDKRPAARAKKAS